MKSVLVECEFSFVCHLFEKNGIIKKQLKMLSFKRRSKAFFLLIMAFTWGSEQSKARLQLWSVQSINEQGLGWARLNTGDPSFSGCLLGSGSERDFVLKTGRCRLNRLLILSMSC